MDIGSTFFYKYRRFIKTLKIYLLLAGPGLIVMLADNDAGGITTYTVTGAKYGYGLIWFLLLLLPVAYIVQEMTVRLGAVTKRGHAEAIFDAFGSFWGWFSFLDLALVNWLTLDYRVHRHDCSARHLPYSTSSYGCTCIHRHDAHGAAG